jgi:hypothetical protein
MRTQNRRRHYVPANALRRSPVTSALCSTDLARVSTVALSCISWRSCCVRVGARHRASVFAALRGAGFRTVLAPSVNNRLVIMSMSISQTELEQDLRPRARTLSWMASLSVAAGEMRAAEGYLLELLAWCAFADRSIIDVAGDGNEGPHQA